MNRFAGFLVVAIVFAVNSSSTAAIRQQAEHRVKVIHQVAPAYPEEAKRERVEGNVVLDVTVEESGNVSMTKVISGHRLLQQAAVDAVKQWRFANDTNAAVTIQLTIAFALKPDAVQNSQTKSPLTNTYKVDAVYPEAARQEGIQGEVPVEITVNDNGEVTDARATGGNQKLRQAAVEAARQFRFSNSSGKTVVATITFKFVLD